MLDFRLIYIKTMKFPATSEARFAHNRWVIKVSSKPPMQRKPYLRLTHSINTAYANSNMDVDVGRCLFFTKAKSNMLASKASLVR